MKYPRVSPKDELGYYTLEISLLRGSIRLTESELAKLRDRIIAALPDQTGKQDQKDKDKLDAVHPVCKSCGLPAEYHWVHCTGCGKELTKEEKPSIRTGIERRCFKCGHRYYRGNYCWKCGIKLKDI